MFALFQLVATVIDLYIWAIVISVILSWLVAFGVVNTQNTVVRMIGEFLFKITEPLLAPIRRFMPNLGSVDISPIVLILLLVFLRNLVIHDIAAAMVQ